MKRPFIDHLWSKIVEKDAVAKVMIEAKIKQLDDVAEAIRKNFGSDAVENVLDYTLVKRALSNVWFTCQVQQNRLPQMTTISTRATPTIELLKHRTLSIQS